MNISTFIARRYLFAKKSRNIINLISFISLFGLFVSSAALIIILSGFNGIQQYVEQMYGRHSPDIYIEPLKGKIINKDHPVHKAIQTKTAADMIISSRDKDRGFLEQKTVVEGSVSGEKQAGFRGLGTEENKGNQTPEETDSKENIATTANGLAEAANLAAEFVHTIAEGNEQKTQSSISKTTGNSR